VKGWVRQRSLNQRFNDKSLIASVAAGNPLPGQLMHDALGDIAPSLDHVTGGGGATTPVHRTMV
jgi:hypothetical protein